MTLFNKTLANSKNVFTSKVASKGVVQQTKTQTVTAKQAKIDSFPKAVIDSLAKASTQTKESNPKDFGLFLTNNAANSKILKPQITPTESSLIGATAKPGLVVIEDAASSIIGSIPSVIDQKMIEAGQKIVEIAREQDARAPAENILQPPPDNIVPVSLPDEEVLETTNQALLFQPSINYLEKFVGISTLAVSDRPFIAGILENGILENGIPKESVLFIRRINTQKYKEVKYTILRRASFYEDEFFPIGELSGTNISLDSRYIQIADEFFPEHNRNSLITFTDTNLLPHQSYVYRVKIEFREWSDKEKQDLSNTLRRVGQIAESGGLIGRLGSNFFGRSE